MFDRVLSTKYTSVSNLSTEYQFSNWQYIRNRQNLDHSELPKHNKRRVECAQVKWTSTFELYLELFFCLKFFSKDSF